MKNISLFIVLIFYNLLVHSSDSVSGHLSSHGTVFNSLEKKIENLPELSQNRDQINAAEYRDKRDNLRAGELSKDIEAWFKEVEASNKQVQQKVVTDRADMLSAWWCCFCFCCC